MDKSAWKQKVLEFWNTLEHNNGVITSEQFLQEHDFFYKQCMKDFQCMKTVHDCIVEVLTEKVNTIDRNLFMLCASHIHGVCAPINRFYVADGQPNIYQFAQSLLPSF
jgi:hypothetical protein